MRIAPAVGEYRRMPRWLVTASVGVLVLLVLVTVYWWRARRPVVTPTATPPVAAVTAVARVWVSTADRRLRLTPCPPRRTPARQRRTRKARVSGSSQFQ